MADSIRPRRIVAMHVPRSDAEKVEMSLRPEMRGPQSRQFRDRRRRSGAEILVARSSAADNSATTRLRRPAGPMTSTRAASPRTMKEASSSESNRTDAVTQPSVEDSSGPTRSSWHQAVRASAALGSRRRVAAY